MNKVGRKAKAVPPVYWKVSINGELAAKLELYFHDPISGKPQFGARSSLINQLLMNWLDEKQKKELTT